MRGKKPFVLSLLIVVLAILSVAVLSGCGSTATTTTTAAGTETTAATTATTAAGTETTAATTATTAAPAAFDGEIVIGAICSITGPGAMGGAEQQWAYEKAFADINAAGGVTIDGKKMELKLKFYDDKSDNQEAAAAAEKIIKVDGIKLILSTQSSLLNMSAATVAEKYGAFYQMWATYLSMFKAQNLKWSADMFFAPGQATIGPFAVAAAQPEAERPTRWGLLLTDDVDGQALGKGAAASAEATGATIVLTESYTAGSKDFSASILKMKQANVDAVCVFASPADGITFVKQMKEANYSPKLLFGWKGFWPTQFAEGLGADADYVLSDGLWSEQYPYPGAKELGQAYKDSHDGVDSVSVGVPYTVARILAQAIQNAGSIDPGAVRDAVWNHTFPGTVMGDVTYDETGATGISSVVNQWMGQDRILLYPGNEGQLKWFVPWDQR